MEETDINKIENKTKSILRPKTSKKISFSEKETKHMSIAINTINTMNTKNINNSNNNIKSTFTEKSKKQNNLLFSKFDFDNDYMKKEAKSFKIKLKNLNNINLLDNKEKIDGLYKWENLFNNLNPVRLYISFKQLRLEQKNKKGESCEKIYENIKDYKSPILLVDLPEDQMNLFFNRKSSPSEKNINSGKKSHSIRPVSMYSPREENSCFYYSNTFSDYYKEDFKSFCEKIPVLKAKLKIKSGKLKKEIYKNNKELINKFRILEEKSKNDDFIFDKQDLIIAGKRKNPLPLVKSVILQKIKSTYNFDEKKNDDIEINHRSRNSLNKKFNNNLGNKFSKGLLLSYYDVNDPSLSLFKENLNQNIKNIKNNNFPNNYKNQRNIEVYTLNNDISLKKDQETQKSNNSKEDPPKKEINLKTQIQKSKLNLEDINSNKKNIKQNINIHLTPKINIKPILNTENLFQEEYKPPHSFPIKTSSNVGNISYDKIKNLIKEKQFLNIFKFDTPTKAQSSIPMKVENSLSNKTDLQLILDSKKIKPKKNWTLFDSIYNKNKKRTKSHYLYDKNGNLIKDEKNKFNVIYFNKCIKTQFDKDLTKLKKNFDNNCFFPINAFNKGYAQIKKMKNKKEKDKENKKDKNELSTRNNTNFLDNYSMEN